MTQRTRPPAWLTALSAAVGLWLVVAGLRSMATTVSTPAVTITDVRVTNVRDKSFTVSWVTDQPATGEVHYGTDPANLGQIAHDDRGRETRDDTHYVTLANLAPEVTYYFDVVSDGTTDDNGGAHYAVTTGPTLGVPPSDTIYGQVFRSDGSTPATGTIVYILLRDADGKGSSGEASPLSALVDSGGYWYTNLANVRTTDLTDYFSYSASGDEVVLTAQGAGEGTASQTTDTANDTPAPDMVLVTTATPTSEPTHTATSTPTDTPEVTSTPTSTGSPTATATPTGSVPVTPTPTATPTHTPTPALAITQVRVTNVRDESFTVSWVTNRSAAGEVHYGTDPANLNQTAPDDRGAGTHDDTHYVTLANLTPETTYYFDVASDGTTDDNGGTHYTVTTGPTLGVPLPDIIYSRVFSSDGVTPAEGAIVYILLRDADGKGSSGEARPLSALVASNGDWHTDLGNVRTADLSGYFSYSRNGDEVELRAQGAGDGTASQVVDTGDDSPAPDMVLTRAATPTPTPTGTPTACYDFNGDGQVGMEDVQAVAGHWRCRPGDACYAADYDIESDGEVNAVDIMRVVAQWGRTCDMVAGAGR